MSETERDDILAALARLETKLEEREKSTDFIRNLVLTFVVIGLSSLVTLVADHFRLADVAQTVSTLKPQHDQMWWRYEAKP